jgi:uncharacterized protein YbbC (DUF1343 family)
MKTGLDVLIEGNFKSLKNQRIGLVTHAAALARDYHSALHHFANTSHCTLAAVFGPEHGLSSEAQDLIPVHERRGNDQFAVHSLYRDTFASLKPSPAMLAGLDALVIDLQDVGSRYYTFQATMLYCLEACAEAGVPVMVLDRPNPIGRAIEGPTVQAGFESFVGAHNICTRHGMTIGELALLYRAERVPSVQLSVIACEDYSPRIEDAWHVPPSPNMPTTATALVYPGLCLVEGTNLSEGRGTTRPFEYVGFPGVDNHRIAANLNADACGFHAVPVRFLPTFQKHANTPCNGIFIVNTNQGAERPVEFGLRVVMEFRQATDEHFRWRTETYEFVSHIPAIDLLFGSARERGMIEAGERWSDIVACWREEEAAFRQRREPFLKY